MKLAEIIAECQKIEGWFTPEQMRKLYTIVHNTKGLLIEIGTYQGKSTTYWRLANPGIEIITIDIAKYLTDTEIEKLDVSFIQGDSRYVGSCGKKCDILFIDGEDDLMVTDMDNWWPCVKKGGYMLVHNYLTVGKRIKQDADEWIAGHKVWLVKETADILIVQK